MTEPVASSWNTKALLGKAQLYADMMLAVDRNSWQFGLWSSLMLELLARAALSNISPALLADAKDWRHIYSSLGHKPLAKSVAVRSISTNEVFIRLNEIYPQELTEQLKSDCMSHIHRRNQELHTGDMVFHSATEAGWLPSFYEACSVLLACLDTDLEFLFDRDESVAANAMIDAAKKTKADEVLATIEWHRKNWKSKDQLDKEKLVERAMMWATKDVGHRVKCPACDSNAIVTGDPIKPSKTVVEGGILYEKQDRLPGKFGCRACDLKIAGLSSLMVAGLGAPYVSKSPYDVNAHFYEIEEGNPWLDDNNEPI